MFTRKISLWLEEWEWYSDFMKGADRLNDLIIKKANIIRDSIVLDAWCWTGATVHYIQEKIWCNITWVDISWVRIEEANQRISRENKDKMNFIKMSLDDITFDSESFSHIISQSVLYHVHEREQAIQQLYKILKKDWIFVFEDFVRPNNTITKESEEYVYERLHYRTDFNHNTYQEFLEKVWFTVIEAIDLSEHMRTSYSFLVEIVKDKLEHGDPSLMEWYQKLYEAYPKMVEAIEREDLWRSLFVCKK